MSIIWVKNGLVFSYDEGIIIGPIDGLPLGAFDVTEL